MYANRLSYFKKIEDHDGRGDEDEGAIMFQLDGLTATLEFTNMDTGEVERTTMTEPDFAAPPILRPEWFDDINVFCMYAGHSGEFQHVSPDNLQEFRRQLEIPEEYTRLGDMQFSSRIPPSSSNELRLLLIGQATDSVADW